MPDTVPIRPDGLQIDENRPFQERFWRIQRIAWAAYFLLILCAALGLTGLSGPLSQGRATLAGAEVSWPRISRLGAPETLTILMSNPGNGPEVTLGPDLSTLFQIETITPRPAMESGGDGLRMAFFPDPVSPYRVLLSLRAQRAGWARTRITIGTTTTTITTLVLP